MGYLLPPVLQWLVPFLPLIPPISVVNTVNLCAGEPPDIVAISADEIALLLTNPRVGGFYVVAKKVWDILLNRLWYQVCQCKIDPTPPPPAGQPAPPGLPVINPPYLLPPPTPQACAVAANVNGPLAGNPPTLNFQPEYNLSPEQTTAQIHFINGTQGAGPHPDMTFDINFWLSHKTVLAQHYSMLVPNGAFRQITVPIPVGSVSLDASASSASATTNWAVGAIDLFCNGQSPVAPPQQPCVTDPVVLTQLQAILDMVVLIQRQQVPFGTIPGTAHAGLVGNAEFPVQGLIGAVVSLTAIPAYVGTLLGDPQQLFDVGFVTWGDVNGWRRSERVTTTPFVTMPAAAGELTKIGFSFAPNVVATITELKREPS